MTINTGHHKDSGSIATSHLMPKVSLLSYVHLHAGHLLPVIQSHVFQDSSPQATVLFIMATVVQFRAMMALCRAMMAL